MMKGYKFIVWLETKHGNVQRPSPVFHACNLKEAWKKFERDYPLKDGEWVYKVECLGTVKKVVETRYEYTPLKKPRYESRY